MILIPLWLVAIGWTIESIVLLWVHKRLTLFERLTLIIPTFSIITLSLTFLVIPVPYHIEANANRLVILSYLLWHTVLLYLTRKRHI